MATKKYLDYAGLKRVLAKLLPGARKIWHGTLAEWEALSATEKAKYDQAEVIDEYTGVPVVVDKVESGNLNPVTSNAVAGVFNTVDTIPVTVNSSFNPQDVSCKKAGRVVILNFRGSMFNTPLSTDANDGTILGSIPAVYAPKSLVSAMVAGWDGVIRKTALTVDKKGNIYGWGEVSTNNQYMWGQLSWVLED